MGGNETDHQVAVMVHYVGGPSFENLLIYKT